MSPPYLHHCNADERAIHTLNNHLIAVLCITDENFPLDLCYKFFPQCLITLNLLRVYHFNTKLSSYAQFHGAFHFNRTTLAPPVNQVLIHENPEF